MHIIEEKPELWPFILASVMLHLLAFVLIPIIVPMTNFKEKPIEIFNVAPVPEVNSNPQRIADIEEPAVQKKPKAPKFLGMYDSEVPQETVGPSNRATEKKGSRGQPKTESKPKEKAAAKKEVLKGSKDRLYAFNRNIFEDKRMSSSTEGNAKKDSKGGLDDFYPDFRRGEHTYLNVLRYPDVEYFVRLKRAFKIAFNPAPVLRGYFSQNLISRGQVDVVLGVSVDKSGELKELFVFRGSGLGGYDEEALRTVRASSPFSSPPAKFLEGDGLLRMSWTFTVYL